jgi:pimeloyl-ACP methyl ester carboxylesterase
VTRVLAHRRVGAGPRAVVLLHGFLGAARNLATLARDLVARDAGLSAVTLDLTGHGDSPPLPPGADLGTLAADVLATARQLGLGSPLAIAGHSLGGRVALRAGLAEPAALGRLVLLDITPSPVAVPDTSRLVELLLAAPARAPSRDDFRVNFRAGGLDERLVEWLLQNLGHAAGEYRWRVDRAALAALHDRTSGEDLWAAVEGARSYAAACVRGGRSPYVGEADVRRLVAAGCSVDTVEGAGHFLHIDAPGEVADRLLARLA